MTSITPIIMSGGAGTRLWPLSRKSEPKQYRALVTNRSMLEETVARLEAGGQEVARPVVICGDAHCGKIRTLLTRDGAAAPVIITEPVGRNPAPVAIIAACMSRSPTRKASSSSCPPTITSATRKVSGRR